MKIITVALVLLLELYCGTVISSNVAVTQVSSFHHLNITTENEAANVSEAKEKILKNISHVGNNEIFNADEGMQKSLNERSYVFINQLMKRPLNKKVFNLKMEKLTNTFSEQDYSSSKVLGNVFPGILSKNHQQNFHFFIPNKDNHYLSPKYSIKSQNKQNSYINAVQLPLQQERTPINKIKSPILTDVKTPIARVDTRYESNRGKKHRLLELNYLEKPKRRFPFAQHRLNYNYGIASYPMRRSALRNHGHQNEKENSMLPVNDKYARILEQIGNVIEKDVDNNITENEYDKKICNNCYALVPNQFNNKSIKSKVDGLSGCICENVNKYDTFGEIIGMLEDKDQSTTDVSLDYTN